jgi:hypothetical protein
MAELKKRDILAEVLIGSLTAVAFEEMIRTVHDSASRNGLTPLTLGLALIFALTTIRFLVGNLLSIIKGDAESRSGFKWFYDLMVIVALAAVLAFLGGLCGEDSAPLKFSFFDVLCVVFVIDAIWILSLWLGERKLLLWEWFGLDIVMLALTLGVYAFSGRATAYTPAGILFFVVANILVFGVDVWLQKERYHLF